jgi:predicted transposase YbfD/YdcC
VLCGCQNAEEMQDWGRKEEPWLRTFLTLPHGIPSQDTYLRVLASLDAQQFRRAFAAWVNQVLAPLGFAAQVAIDGKTSRRSGSTLRGQSPVHLVSALACDWGLVLGQTRTADKSNEIVAIPKLLKALNLQGALVTIDAMGCQRDIADQIVEQGADYLLQVKGNQPALLQEVKSVFQAATASTPVPKDQGPPPVLQRHQQTDGDHGRIEVRTTEVCHDFADYLSTSERWTRLRAVVRVTCQREDKATGHSSVEEHYYISSRPLHAQQAGDAVRRHWLIENQLHWTLDVSFGEDACPVRASLGAENFALVRHFAFNLLRGYRGDRYSIPRRQRLCDWDLAYRLKVLQSSV